MQVYVLADYYIILSRLPITLAFVNFRKETTALLDGHILMARTHPVHHVGVPLALVGILVLTDVTLDRQDVHVD